MYKLADMIQEPLVNVVDTDNDKDGIIHIANIKGGVGKSTIATNLAVALSLRAPTLLIDLDVQGSTTYALGMEHTDVPYSSWDLFKHRFKESGPQTDQFSVSRAINRAIKSLAGSFVSSITPTPTVSDITVNLRHNLDLVVATPDLFRYIYFFHIQNLISNLQLLKNYYKYIVIDTPSVWNSVTKALYLNSDLNLIPVTLNALSTRSLREYLKNVKQMTLHNPNVRIRIIKNEVYGKNSVTLRGKSRTMSENRQFLETLCEQVIISNSSGKSVLPQSIILDLEIPESSMVRNAQDVGKSVYEYHQMSTVAKSFELLAEQVVSVLNGDITRTKALSFPLPKKIYGFLGKAAAAAIFLSVFMNSQTTISIPTPLPLAPQQLASIPNTVFEYTVSDSRSLLKIAKYAICHFSAIVPSDEQIGEYLKETFTIHNMTRKNSQPRISEETSVPLGTRIKFYPPLKITNKNSPYLTPVYSYFTKMVADSFSYVTGDWCERGYGGGTPHFGIDIATSFGTEVISPIDGTLYQQNSVTAGRMIGIVNDKMVIFFCHLDKRYHSNGRKIKKGEKIGTVGMTGVTSGPHVHIGYGLEAPSSSGGTVFNNRSYKLTDPKLFFYREQYLAQKH